MWMRFTSKLSTGLAVFAMLHAAGCENGVTEPQDPGYAWAGVYQSEVRAGGASGTWLASEPLEVTSDGRVFVGAIEMVNVNLGEASVVWTMKGGNPHSAVVSFLDGSVPNGAWGPDGAEGVLFQGWIEYPGEERSTYRGLRR